MPDELRLDACIAKKLFFERENAEQAVDVTPQRGQPSLAPGPHLRGDEINHLDPGASVGFLRAVTGDLEMPATDWLGQ